MQTLVVVIVSPTEELSLACMTTLLKLQVAAARLNQCKLDVRVAHTFLEALNLYSHGEWVVAIDAFAAVPTDFVFALTSCEHDVIAGVYPLPELDWDRVKKVFDDPDATEPIEHAGNRYNVAPEPKHMTRYAPVGAIRELKILAVRSALLEKMAGPDVSYDGGYLFAHDSVFENEFQNAYQTFARKCQQAGAKIVADLDSPCTMSGPALFAGCVGMRRNGLR